ncbi:MAG: DUF4258 domain-containing protein [Chitinophagaceae bacterium]|nr:DUF4258 domain-containing protein [Chitinophagaceae bacterium]
MKRRRIYLLPAVVLSALLIWYAAGTTSSNNDQKVLPATGDVSFNRRLKPVIYTKHARCRMDCRRIDEAEVTDILYNGVINYSKSNLHGKPDPTYALEGITRDKQRVRIIFAPSKKGMVVITCIDMDEEWTCDCR